MIKINLLKEKKKKQMTLPIGGIVVGMWVFACIGGVYVYAQDCDKRVEDQAQTLVPLRGEVERLEQFFRRKKSLEQDLHNHKITLTDYQGILSKKTGSWTKVFYRFEEFVARAKTVWITQVRIDSEGGVSLSGLSMEAEKDGDSKKRKVTTQGVTDFIKILQQATDVVNQVVISELQHETLDKQPVAKFVMQFMMNKD
ncbi:MAG: hypothetical protein H3C47_07380 [Candidatus Cloacimonetes bacterium]|nr:hypothetical protein [Candidatus Cloacimonadota bacterium]